MSYGHTFQEMQNVNKMWDVGILIKETVTKLIKTQALAQNIFINLCHNDQKLWFLD